MTFLNKKYLLGTKRYLNISCIVFGPWFFSCRSRDVFSGLRWQNYVVVTHDSFSWIPKGLFDGQPTKSSHRLVLLFIVSCLFVFEDLFILNPNFCSFEICMNLLSTRAATLWPSPRCFWAVPQLPPGWKLCTPTQRPQGGHGPSHDVILLPCCWPKGEAWDSRGTHTGATETSDYPSEPTPHTAESLARIPQTQGIPVGNRKPWFFMSPGNQLKSTKTLGIQDLAVVFFFS